MRVTKVVREYIEKKVRLKVEPKYEARKQMEQTQQDVLNDMFNSATKAAQKAFNEVVDKTIVEHDFLLDRRTENPARISCYGPKCVVVDRPDSMNWQTCMSLEIKEKVDDIIVNLELGGTKADIDRMLEEL